ncbi:reverse transcriptase [Trichonephila clavipes]|nr:reverse transcriptase [Trichonephila clavipes]
MAKREPTLILRRAHNIISTYTDKCIAMTQNTKYLGKLWGTLFTVGPIQWHLERAETVARFRLTTEYDFLGINLHWLDLVADEACPLCGSAGMDDDHLF